MIDLNETKLSSESSKSSPKYLVVDHDLVNTSEKREFAKMTMLPMEAGIFVATYEAALKAVKSNHQLVFAWVDIRIPQNKNDRAFDSRKKIDLKALSSQIKDLKNEWGIKLLAKIKNIKTFVYSSYVDKSSLEKEANCHENVVGYSSKPFDFRDLQVIKPYLEKYFSGEKFVAISRAFDYSSFDDETVSFVQEKTKEIRRLLRRSSQDIIDIGSYLIEVKNKLGHGNFYNWLDAEFDWSYTSAGRFMSVANRFKSFSVGDLDIMPTALYELASSSVPEEAVTEAFELAQTGQVLDQKTAKAIKAKYKALKAQTESIVQPQDLEGAESTQTRSKGTALSLESISPPSSGLPGLPEKKDKIKQSILAVVPSKKAVKNSWWQLGEHNQLFCGEPKSNEFLKRLTQDIGLSMTFLPENDFSLVPPIKSFFSLTFQSNYEEIEIDSLIEESIRTTTKPDEIIVFNYLYYIELLEMAEKLKCHFIVAEPDLEKCEQILTRWREKGSVMRITS